MGEVIVVTSGKGGVGKTTTTANLGMALAMLDKKVCVIDADIGLRNLDVIMGLESRIVFDIVDLVNGVCKPRQAMIKDKRNDNLYLIPAAQTKDKSALNQEQMKTLTAELKKEFDYVIVDCPAGIEQGFKNAIAGADRAIVVTTPEVSAVRDADRIIGLLEAAELYNPKLILNRIKIAMVNKGDMLSVDDVKEILSIDVIGIVPDDENIVVSSNRGEPAALSQSSKAGSAYRNISRRIVGEQVPFLDLNEGTGFLSKFFQLFNR